MGITSMLTDSYDLYGTQPLNTAQRSNRGRKESDLGQPPCFTDKETEVQGGGKISSHNHMADGGRAGIQLASALLTLIFAAVQ